MESRLPAGPCSLGSRHRTPRRLRQGWRAQHLTLEQPRLLKAPKALCQPWLTAGSDMAPLCVWGCCKHRLCLELCICGTAGVILALAQRRAEGLPLPCGAAAGPVLPGLEKKTHPLPAQPLPSGTDPSKELGQSPLKGRGCHFDRSHLKRCLEALALSAAGSAARAKPVIPAGPSECEPVESYCIVVEPILRIIPG